MAPNFMQSTRASRVALQLAINTLLSAPGNEKYDYDDIRPEGTRHMDPTISTTSHGASYYAFGLSIFNAYDIQLDEHAFPQISRKADLPSDHMFPETSEFWFRAELMKLHCFQDGTITAATVQNFLPPELRGDPTSPRAKEFINKLVKSKENMRRALITDTLLPLVLWWCKNIKFRDVNTSHPKALTDFFLARIKEDLSTVVWWLRPLASLVNVHWMFQQNAAAPGTEDIKVRTVKYCVARMVAIIDLVYRHLVHHDPANGPNFFRNNAAVTNGLRGIKNLPCVTQWHVDIREWPSSHESRRSALKQ